MSTFSCALKKGNGTREMVHVQSFVFCSFQEKKERKKVIIIPFICYYRVELNLSFT